jgi:hypothetical protein
VDRRARRNVRHCPIEGSSIRSKDSRGHRPGRGEPLYLPFGRPSMCAKPGVYPSIPVPGITSATRSRSTVAGRAAMDDSPPRRGGPLFT